MSEQRDDTTEREEPSGGESERQKPGSYYYDDATGYEIYDPEKDDEGEDDETMPEGTRSPLNLSKPNRLIIPLM